MVGQQDQLDRNKDCERPWADIHHEILSLILSNLVGADSSHFRATCRSWRLATTYFPPPTGSALSRLPYLMSLKASTCTFFQPLDNTTWIHEAIPELEGAVIRRSSWGWLLMSKGIEKQFFFNPSTKDIIPLPDLPSYWGGVVDEYFSSPPTSPDCVVIAFRDPAITTQIGIVKRGEDKWKFDELENQDFRFKKDATVWENSKLYCLGEAGDIGELDLSQEIGSMNWNIVTEPLFSWPCYKIRQSFMMKCDGGGMLAVFVQGEERKVEVKRLELPNMVWRDVESLKDQALYLSHGGSFLVDTPNRWESNKIYFPRFYRENGVFYSFETQKNHSIAGDYSNKTCANFAYQECNLD